MGQSGKVQINSKALGRYRSFHPWIFRSDIVDCQADSAGVVQVISPKGQALGQAFYSPSSLIALRMITRENEEFSAGLLKKRLLRAFEWRKKILPQVKIGRIIFGEADGIPSLILEKFDDYWVFQTLSAGLETFKEKIIDWVRESFEPKGIVERNDATVREKEGLPLIKQIAWGHCPREIPIEIEGRTYTLDLLEGQKTGFFLDQRFNAKLAAPFLRGRLLDAFCYSGQFALQASDYVDEILCIDQSESALERVQNTAQLNHIQKISTLAVNVFDFLKSEDQKKARWDSIVLDPPAFVKSRSHLEAALRGYKEINLRALKVLNPKGILVTFSCSQNLNRDDFFKVLKESARDAKREVQILQEFHQAPDHPRLLSMPESEYLKGCLVQVL